MGAVEAMLMGSSQHKIPQCIILGYPRVARLTASFLLPVLNKFSCLGHFKYSKEVKLLLHLPEPVQVTAHCVFGGRHSCQDIGRQTDPLQTA